MSKITVLPTSVGDYYQQITCDFGSPVLVLDSAKAKKTYRELAEALPGVDLHYAMKSQSNTQFLEAIIEEGASIDIATNGELEILKQLSVQPKSVIHTHPFKKESDISAPFEFGCKTFVVDCKEEIDKFLAYGSQLELLLRVSYSNDQAKIDLSKKFGCPINEVPCLMAYAKDKGLKITGLSFHVGSQCSSGDLHAAAIEMCLPLFSQYSGLTTLDIGGGFPAPYEDVLPNLYDFCEPIRLALEKCPEAIRLIAEPGRCLSGPSFQSIATVMGATDAAKARWCFLDDGVYGLFSGAFYSGNQYPLFVFSNDSKRVNSVLAGPTCDSVDVIYENVELPMMAEGDVVVGSCMGAYTNTTATEFNAIPKARTIVINGHFEQVEKLAQH